MLMNINFLSLCYKPSGCFIEDIWQSSLNKSQPILTAKLGFSAIFFLSITTILFHSAPVLANSLTQEIVLTPIQIEQLKLEFTHPQKTENSAGLFFPGQVVLPTNAQQLITAPQAGVVDKIEVNTGQMVKKGQAIAHISSPDGVVLQRNYLEMTAQFKLAESNFKRDETLFQEGIIGEKRLLTTKTEFESAKIRLEQARQALKLANIDEQTLSRTKNYSPGFFLRSDQSGMVLEQMISLGQRVNLADPMFRIGKLDKLWIEIRLPITQLPLMQKGMSIAIPKYNVNGTVIDRVKQVKESDQTILIRAVLESNVSNLAPGQWVEAELFTHDSKPSYRITKNAIVRDKKNRTYVFQKSKRGVLPTAVKLVGDLEHDVLLDGDTIFQDAILTKGVSNTNFMWQEHAITKP